MKTRIRYKCSCMQDEVSIDVDARTAVEEITGWLERVVRPALGSDHSKRSPFCSAGAVEYLKLPVPEDGRNIGESGEKLN